MKRSSGIRVVSIGLLALAIFCLLCSAAEEPVSQSSAAEEPASEPSAAEEPVLELGKAEEQQSTNANPSPSPSPSQTTESQSSTNSAGPDVTVPPSPPPIDQRALDDLRTDIQSSVERSANHNAEAISAGLSVMGAALDRMLALQDEVRQTTTAELNRNREVATNAVYEAARRQSELLRQEVKSSTNTLVIVVGIFAAAGLIGLVFILLIVFRLIGRFSELAALAPSRAQLIGPGMHPFPAQALAGQSVPGIAPGGPASPVVQPTSLSEAEQASGRFQIAIDQLQKRIQELEDTTQTGAGDHPVGASISAPVSAAAAGHPHVAALSSASNIQPLPAGATAAAPALEGEEAPSPPSRTSLLLGKGQALMNLDATDSALQCFDEILTSDPTNTEALVKKGMALEKIQDWEQALENYDRAIAVDDSLTVAYLYRGGVCNRLQRYREALESYEQALRTEKKIRAS